MCVRFVPFVVQLTLPPRVESSFPFVLSSVSVRGVPDLGCRLCTELCDCADYGK